MSAPTISEKGIIFLEVWKAHDRAASRISTTGDVEAKNGRRYWPSVNALKEETEAFCDALEIYTIELNVNPVLFMRCLHDLRREGVAHEKGINLVLVYLDRVNNGV